jgi:RHS repeat-associated protein
VYDGWLPVVEEVLDPWDNLMYQNSYIWGPNPGGTRNPGIGATGQLALIIHQPKHGPPQISAPVYNHRLDVVRLVDVETGNIVAKYEYSPFVKTLSVSGARADHNPFRFAGAYFDPETSTYNFGLRHYDPRTKQWLSRDPIWEAGGLNLFSYGDNNPIMNIDVLGLALLDSPEWTFKLHAWFHRKFGNESRAQEIMNDLAWQTAQNQSGGVMDPLGAMLPMHAMGGRSVPPDMNALQLHNTMRFVTNGSVSVAGTTFAGTAYGFGYGYALGPGAYGLGKSAVLAAKAEA